MKTDCALKRRTFLKALGMGALSLPFAGVLNPAAAADWPSKPIRLVIGYGAGGGTDIFNRSLVQGMEGPLKATINATNMPGSVAAVATNYVYTKPADGYLWLGTSNFNKFLRVMNYHKSNPWKDWVWFPGAGTTQGWAVKPDSPLKTFQDLLDLAKKGSASLSTSGVGGIWHEGDAIMANAAGVKFNYVPYKGGAPATMACLQGEVTAVGSGMHEQVEFIKTGKLRNLAVFSDQSMVVGGVTCEPVTKYVPALKEYAPFGGDITMALRKDTPIEILKAVNQAFLKGINDPKFEAILEKKIAYKMKMTPAQAAKMAAKKESVTAWTFKELGIAKADPKDFGIPRPEEFEAWWPPKDYEPVNV